ncbi:macro domain-containing protein [Actinomyces slackii]|uniref:Protein-ADP-ribose hydrolase n=1 Tax=Actinomyces slackii TaxID=52774 RepID=A0A3S4TB46_9ACTO|nr:macro domain-containing protein [Actinomyces slackii]VEG73825.1 O-acetyl-ADP-ribose deacetylase [Actinomyces slackii]
MSGCRQGAMGAQEELLARAAGASGAGAQGLSGAADRGPWDRLSLLRRLVLELMRTDGPVFDSWGDMTIPAGVEELRVYLDYLLTTRPPGPLPDHAAADLDLLLSAEAAARGAVEAMSLPTLASTHGVPGLLGERVALWHGELARLRADAVVNAANSRMIGCFVPGHKCVDNMLHSAAGPAMRAECARYMADAEAADPSRRDTGEPSGRAVLTRGYHLPALYVIHSVGPMADRGQGPNPADRALLESCYTSSLDLAADIGMNSVGLCSISTGAFGYPKRWAATAAMDALARWVVDHPHSPMRIVIGLSAQAELNAYEQALAPAP